MKNVLRIITVIGIIGGGTFFFREWALQEFNSTFASLDASFVGTEQVAQVAGVFATASTSEATLGTSTPVAYTGPDNFLFITPRKNAVMYQGCTYPVTWMASSTLQSLTLTLSDAGTRQAISGDYSGIPQEITGNNIQSIEWKVGARVWPGEYFFQLTSLNKKEVDEKSYRFTVKAIPNTVLEQDRKDICEDSSDLVI